MSGFPLTSSVVQGGDSIDILGLAQFCAQVMFGVLRHVSTSSALVLYLAQNAAQNAAQFGAQDFQCLLNRPPDTKTKVLRITRTFKNASGKEYTRTELVRMITSDNY